MSEVENPHKGRELLLVIEGNKPLGSVSMCSDEAAVVFRKVGLYTFIKNGDVYFARTIEPINVYKMLTSKSANLIVKSPAEHKRLMGRLFGYTEEEIDVFIEANLPCDCSNCNQPQ